jgi:hypothetical protein
MSIGGIMREHIDFENDARLGRWTESLFESIKTLHAVSGVEPNFSPESLVSIWTCSVIGHARQLVNLLRFALELPKSRFGTTGVHASHLHDA